LYTQSFYLEIYFLIKATADETLNSEKNQKAEMIAKALKNEGAVEVHYK
jgi:hypothetical protein